MTKLIVLASLIVSSVFSLCPAEVRYSITDLGTLGGTTSASGINDSGQVAGSSRNAANDYRAFLYDETGMHDLGTLGGAHSIANSVNDSGQVAGWSVTAGGYMHAFLYNGTAMTDLGTLGGDGSWAEGINNSGQIVGRSRTSGDVRHAFLYDGTTMLDLNDLIPSGSGWVLKYAGDINSSGQIVGNGQIDGETHAYLLTPCNYVLTGDLDYNCKVNLADFAMMAINWMIDCNADPSDPACVSE